MILEIILSIPVFIVVWFVIFKVVIILEGRKILKNLPKKLEKQNKRFYDEIKKELGMEEKKEEVVDNQNYFMKIYNKLRDRKE